MAALYLLAAAAFAGKAFEYPADTLPRAVSAAGFAAASGLALVAAAVAGRPTITLPSTAAIPAPEAGAAPPKGKK